MSSAEKEEERWDTPWIPIDTGMWYWLKDGIVEQIKMGEEELQKAQTDKDEEKETAVADELAKWEEVIEQLKLMEIKADEYYEGLEKVEKDLKDYKGLQKKVNAALSGTKEMETEHKKSTAEFKRKYNSI